MDKKDNRRSEGRERSDNGLQLIIGRNPVTEALKSGKLIDTIFVDPDAKGSVSNIVRLAKEKGIVVKQARGQKLDRMSGGASHQGVAAMIACTAYSTVERSLKQLVKRTKTPSLLSATK